MRIRVRLWQHINPNKEGWMGGSVITSIDVGHPSQDLRFGLAHQVEVYSVPSANWTAGPCRVQAYPHIEAAGRFAPPIRVEVGSKVVNGFASDRSSLKRHSLVEQVTDDGLRTA